MRPLTVIRLLAALLASLAALTSPAVALAHGMAHAHEARERGLAHGTHARAAETGATAPAHVVSATDDDDDAAAPHRGLHSDVVAKVGSPGTAALVSVPVAVLTPVIASDRAGAFPPNAGVVRLGRACSPDQARAPPVG